MTLNKKSQCKWPNTVFSVCTKLLLPASGNPSIFNSSRSVLRFVGENQICCVFALGFHVNSIVAQPFCCGSQWWCRLDICWGQRQPSFCHCLLPTQTCWCCRCPALSLLCLSQDLSKSLVMFPVSSWEYCPGPQLLAQVLEPCALTCSQRLLWRSSV